MKKYPYFAIEVIRKDLFAIKKIVCEYATVPVDRVGYITLQDALKSAEDQGLEIEKIGSLYEII